MVDNVAITAGTGTTIAADDIGAGILAQRVKPVWGPDGTGNDIDVATGKPLPTQLRSPTGVDLTGSAGTASAAVITVQGIASGTAQPVSIATAPVLVAGSAIIGKFGIDQTTPGTTNGVSITNANANGQATMANSAPVVLASNQASIPVAATTVDPYSQYETVAASQTAQVMGATGATGDYLAGVLVFPGAAASGLVTILDNATTIGTFPGGGTTALPSLVPFMIPIGLFSVSGAWKITTGANVTAVGIGKFT